MAENKDSEAAEAARLLKCSVFGSLVGDIFAMYMEAKKAGDHHGATILLYAHERICQASYELEGKAFDRELPIRLYPNFNEQLVKSKK